MIVSLKQNRVLPVEKLDINETENQLLKGLKSGDRASQSEFYKLYYGKMIPVAIRYTSSKEDANEVLNTSFLAVFRSIHKYKFKGSFEGWVRTIVKRTSIDYCRKYVYKKVNLYEIQEYDIQIYNNAIDTLDALDFLKIIIKVPKASRTVFNLFAIEGYSHKEICMELGISEGTSKWHLSNARKKLVDIINAENYGYEG